MAPQVIVVPNNPSERYDEILADLVETKDSLTALEIELKSARHERNWPVTDVLLPRIWKLEARVVELRDALRVQLAIEFGKVAVQ